MKITAFRDRPGVVSLVGIHHGRIEGLPGGKWRIVQEVEENHQRLVRFPAGQVSVGVRFVLEQICGPETTRQYGFYLDA